MRHFLIKLSFVLLLSSPFLYSESLHDYSFTMHCDKKELMVGGKAHVTLTLRYTNLEDYSIEEAQFENFQTTLLEETERQENNRTWVITQHYALIPQKKGTFTLLSPIAHIESIGLQYQDRYNRNKYLVKTDIQARPCTLNVTPLPQGINVTGTYTLSTKVDKHKVKPGEPVRFTVLLEGDGNIADLNFFSLAIPHTTVYEESTSTHNKYFDIISDVNYTIPAISLEYYNQSTKDIEVLSSQVFSIEVITPYSPQKSKVTILLFLIFIFIGFLYYLYHLFSALSHLDKKATFITALKKSRTRETLLTKVAPYLHRDRQLDRLIFKLEEVKNNEFKLLKKNIISYFIKSKRNE